MYLFEQHQIRGWGSSLNIEWCTVQCFRLALLLCCVQGPLIKRFSHVSKAICHSSKSIFIYKYMISFEMISCTVSNFMGYKISDKMIQKKIIIEDILYLNKNILFTEEDI